MPKSRKGQTHGSQRDNQQNPASIMRPDEVVADEDQMARWRLDLA